MVFLKTLNHLAQRNNPSSSNNARLPHVSTQHPALLPHLFDKRAASCHNRSDRSGKALGQAELDGVSATNNLLNICIELNGRIENPRTIQMKHGALSVHQVSRLL